jgi:hypothetical protein
MVNPPVVLGNATRAQDHWTYVGSLNVMCPSNLVMTWRVLQLERIYGDLIVIYCYLK